MQCCWLDKIMQGLKIWLATNLSPRARFHLLRSDIIKYLRIDIANCRLINDNPTAARALNAHAFQAKKFEIETRIARQRRQSRLKWVVQVFRFPAVASLGARKAKPTEEARGAKCSCLTTDVVRVHTLIFDQAIPDSRDLKYEIAGGCARAAYNYKAAMGKEPRNLPSAMISEPESAILTKSSRIWNTKLVV